MQSGFPERLLRNLTPEQQDEIALLLSPEFAMADRTRIAERILHSRTGSLWRLDIAGWLTEVIGIRALTPDVYGNWRDLIDDSLSFVIAHLSSGRLAAKLSEQLELPAAVPGPFRLLALITKMPGLQKLGQVLARNRHLDPVLREALSQLENSISDVDIEGIRAIIDEQLTPVLTELGVEIEDSILSEATVSAVIRFTWKDEGGAARHGVFKVMKPEIPRLFAEDMDLFQQLSDFVASQADRYGMAVQYLPETLREVRVLLEHELDVTGEQESLAEAASFYRFVPGIRIPKVIVRLCTPRITAMTEECCVKITDATTPAEQRARQLVDGLLVQPLFSSDPVALFHADPHAGNLFYDDSAQKLVLLDWALVGHLTREQRQHTLVLTMMLSLQDVRGAWREIIALSQDASAECAEVCELISDFVSAQPLFVPPSGLASMRLLDSLAQRGVHFPAPLLLFRKALFTIDGVLSDLDGAVDLDALVLGSILQIWPATWIFLFSPATWIALQWSAAFYGSRLWVRMAFNPLAAIPGLVP